MFRPELCTMANDPVEDEYGNDGTVVVMTFDELNCPPETPETIVPEPLPEGVLSALEDMEKTGPLMALAVVIVVDVKEDAVCTNAIAPDPDEVTG